MQSDSTSYSPKHFRKRVKNLSIEVDGQDQEALRASSAQNIRSNQFIFPGIDAQRRKQIDDTITKLHNVESERNTLLKELGKLKEGAVSAIIQKQEVIEQLKEKVQQVEQSKEAMGEQKQREYTNLLQQLEQAVTEVERYKKQVEELRLEHMNEVSKRDQTIYELGQELEQAKLRLYDLSQSEKTLSEKYNQAQSEKQELEDELVKSRVNLSILKESLNNSLPAGSDAGMDETSPRSGIKRKESMGEPFRLRTDQSNDLAESKQQAWLDIQDQEIQRLKLENDQEKERHMREIEQLRRYYEEKLEATRNREADKRMSGPFPRCQSSVSLQSVQNPLPQKKTAVLDLRKELITSERLQFNTNEQNDHVTDKSETTSQFSGRHFQYDMNHKRKRQRTLSNDAIEQTSPNEQKDPITFSQWFKSLSIPTLLVASLMMGGLIAMLIRSKK